jgi:hypothetical protein
MKRDFSSACASLFSQGKELERFSLVKFSVMALLFE